MDGLEWKTQLKKVEWLIGLLNSDSRARFDWKSPPQDLEDLRLSRAHVDEAVHDMLEWDRSLVMVEKLLVVRFLAGRSAQACMFFCCLVAWLG